MIIVIRISGMVNVSKEIEEALHRLRLRRKYSAVLIKPTSANLELLKKIRNHVSYGALSKETLTKLIIRRGQPLESKTKVDAEKIVSGLDKKNLQELGLKPFFRMHSPRGGIESKKHFGVGKGVLGHNKKIDGLIERML